MDEQENRRQPSRLLGWLGVMFIVLGSLNALGNPDDRSRLVLGTVQALLGVAMAVVNFELWRKRPWRR